MKDLNEYIVEAQLILERNEKIFPKPGEHSKMTIFTGDHCQDRQSEREVTNKEIIHAMFDAFKDIDKAYRNKEINASFKNMRTNEFVVIDTRVSKSKPICLAVMLNKSQSDNKLRNPLFTIKTVYKGDDFKGLKTKEKQFYLY